MSGVFNMYADIIPLTKIPLHRPQVYTYEADDFVKEIKVGQIVKVPLYHRQVLGVVKNTKKKVPLSEIKYKKIEKILSKYPLLNSLDLQLAEFISNYYFASLGLILQHLAPDPPRVKIKKVRDELVKINLSLINKKSRKRQVEIAPELIISPAKQRLEKYLQIIQNNLKQRKQILFLVPELSLLPQTLTWLQQNFDSEEVVLLHSSLSKSNEIINWRKAQTNHAKIFLGTRRAIFTSFYNLGHIIIDEEQDLSYKQWDMNPRYDARTIAEKKAQLYGCALTFGTGSPSVSAYFKVKNKTATVILAKAGIVDMRQELQAGNYSIFSDQLQNTISMALKNKQQIILFVNRKGASTFIMCRDCGYVIRCPRCNIALMEHTTKILSCNHCNFKSDSPLTCSQCKSPRIKGFGIGVEKVEYDIKEKFPKAKVSRLDTGITSRLSSLQKRYEEFVSGKIDILVGTQIALRLHSPRLALIAAINIDSILNFPDWRTDEKAWHILNQISQRNDVAHCLIQTYNPENKLLRLLAQNKWDAFYQQELKNREILKYPPFVKMIKLICRSDDYDFLIRESSSVARKLRATLPSGQIIGPIQPINEKIRNFWYRHVIIKLGPEYKDEKLDEILKNLPGSWSIDVDPLT